MKDWKIALLVVMCVIFIFALIVLIFLLWKYGKWSADTKEKSNAPPPTLSCDAQENDNIICHYGNEQLQPTIQEQEEYAESYWHNKENTKMSTYTTAKNCTLVKDCAASERNSYTLWFVDFTNHLHSIDLQVNGHIERGWQVQEIIAQMCNMDTPQTIALVYRDEKQTMHWLDLDLLVNRDDQFCNRMRHTAERPLLLARLTEVQVHDMSTQNNRICFNEKNVCEVSKYKCNDQSRTNDSNNKNINNMFVKVDVSGKKHKFTSASNTAKSEFVFSPQINYEAHSAKKMSCINQTAHVNASFTKNHSSSSVYKNICNYANSVNNNNTNNYSNVPIENSNHHHRYDNNNKKDEEKGNTNNESRYSETTFVTTTSPLLLVPKPIIFPEEEQISTCTPIYIVAAEYYVVSSTSDVDEESVSGNDTHGHVNDKKASPSQLSNVIDENNRLQLDVETLCEFERAMRSGVKHRTIQLYHGPFTNTFLKLHSHTNIISWHFPGKACYDLVRRSADALRFSVDGANPDQWLQYTQPFYLPLGR